MNKFRHLDLFSGIGGFSLAAQWVWGEQHYIHSFVEIDPFCQKVLKKHWPDVPIISDIRDVTYERLFADTISRRWWTSKNQRICGQGVSNSFVNLCSNECEPERTTTTNPNTVDLITGGFPCQPFSAAGKRKGTGDDRFIWPEMLRVIREVHPRWVIAENVPGIISIEKGMVLEQVFTDLESEGYQVQPFIIPACSVNAPHRRDRVWIIANCTESGLSKSRLTGIREYESQAEKGMDGGFKQQNCDAADTERTGLERTNSTGKIRSPFTSRCGHVSEWEENWLEVAARLCRVDARVSNRVDRLKALGNAIVPQVAVPIMQAIKKIDDGEDEQ